MSGAQLVPAAMADTEIKIVDVLVVDDDDVDRERLTRALRRYPTPVRIHEVNSKSAALDALRHAHFDFVFLDFNLRDGDGRDLLPHIQELTDKKCLVVAVTGNGNEQVAANAIKAGIHDYLPKSSVTVARVMATMEEGQRYMTLQNKLQEAEYQLQRRSLYDSLTDLPNRNLFFDRLEQATAQHMRNRMPFAVLMIDLDRFKEVNDKLGHLAGDRVLKEVGARFATLLRATDTIARLGGDEFAALLADVDSVEGAESVAGKIIRSLALPIMVDGQALSVGASVGIALCPLHADTSITLMAYADQAMYRAKRGIQKIVVHAQGQAQDAMTMPTHALIVELDKAIREHELVMYYQPKIRLDTRQVVGFEALVRWQHPERGLLTPDHFIPTVEASSLLGGFTDKTVEIVLSQLERWLELSFNLKVAVNISARMLEDRLFVQRIVDRLAFHRIPRGMLSLEVTETALLVNLGKARAIVAQLRDNGIDLSIDDFGAGFTSYAYLKDFGAPEIKLDASFVSELEENPFNASLVRSLGVLCDALGADFIAEGVERREAWSLLLALGCKLGQGYSIARPMPAAEVITWLNAWNLDLATAGNA